MSCRVRGIQFDTRWNWEGDCVCGFTTGCKGSYESAMESLEEHWYSELSANGLLRTVGFVGAADTSSHRFPAVSAGGELGGIASGESLALGGESAGGVGDVFFAGHKAS
jgi:hypothetical protein